MRKALASYWVSMAVSLAMIAVGIARGSWPETAGWIVSAIYIAICMLQQSVLREYETLVAAAQRAISR